MNVMFGHFGVFVHAAREARDRAVAHLEANPDGHTHQVLITIILSAICTEAFINEIVESIEMYHLKDSRHPCPPELRAFVSALQEIEDNNGRLTLKYIMAARTLTGDSFDKGRQPYQDFDTLVKFRNALVHLKPLDEVEAIPDGFGRMIPPKFIKGLQQRGIVRKADDGVLTSWLSLINTQEMAKWAVEAAFAIISAVLDMMPPTNLSTIDIPAWFRQTLMERN